MSPELRAIQALTQRASPRRRDEVRALESLYLEPCIDAFLRNWMSHTSVTKCSSPKVERIPVFYLGDAEAELWQAQSKTGFYRLWAG